MKVRFFGKKDCLDCLRTYVIINQFDIPYEYIDTDDDRKDVQDFCDENSVDQLPHIQFLNNDTVVIEHIGPIDEKQFEKYIIEMMSK